MKEKIIFLIIGILIGVIVATGCFLLFGKSNEKGGPNGMQPVDENVIQNGGPNGRNGKEGNMTKTDNATSTQTTNNLSNT